MSKGALKEKVFFQWLRSDFEFFQLLTSDLLVCKKY
jgi:hypothetical protein